MTPCFILVILLDAKLFGSLVIPDFKIFYPAFEISESHFSKKV